MSETSRPLRADAQRNRARVIKVAEALLAKDGMSASMREIARQAGVGLATIYRQFPTKEALFEAIVFERVLRLLDAAKAESEGKNPGQAFFDFFEFAVKESTGEKALVDSLAAAGVDVKQGTGPMYREVESATGILLDRAKQAKSVRGDVELPEVLALITATCLAADRQSWSDDLRTKTLAVIFEGLRPKTT